MTAVFFMVRERPAAYDAQLSERNLNTARLRFVCRSFRGAPRAQHRRPDEIVGDQKIGGFLFV
jgi:hypothetical protein